MLHEINKELFEGMETSFTGVLELYTNSCPVCIQLKPVLEEVANEVENVKFYTINAQENMSVARKYKVMSVPTTLIIKEGEVVEKILGYKDKEELKNMILKHF
ncbi:thioredoxin family protein [Thermobrachium celere]|uniref:thioredoxin family protein n=1 Tax=Thermobrachium celere TaxID=53422 RepID=UPI0019445FD9|nr:thioredoxin family protein [Thermobrachium celere]GFR34826.1 thioredoxin [Thermobrachium celere]